jgi:hypothetical protein
MTFIEYLFLFRLNISVAKTSQCLLQCSRSARWLLLLYSHGLVYIFSTITPVNPFIFLSFTWCFMQYQLAIFLVTAIRPSSLITTSKCPICLLHFSDRFHHCFLVNRCIAICNVHCFLAFTFYATIATLMCFFIFLNQYFYVTPVSFSCLLPMGELFCSNLTWKQSGLVMLTRSTLMSAGSAGAMGFHVAKEFYYDRTDKSRSIWREIFKILLPALSVIRYD